jgi:hypothetical protein
MTSKHDPKDMNQMLVNSAEMHAEAAKTKEGNK